jgi:N-acetyl-anhydromuramyl-L-alanine amidase AmpD
MAETTSPAPTAAPRQGVNWRRMLTVWLLLAAAMTIVVVLGTLVLPRGGAASGPGGKAPRTENLAEVVKPKNMAPQRSWRFIIIHHGMIAPATKDGTAAAPETPSALHFIIGNGRGNGPADGKAVSTDRWLDQLDAANTRVPGHTEFNTQGIGICLIGDFDRQKPTARQMTKLQDLILYLQNLYAIPMEKVLTHNDVERVRCPGLLFPTEPLLRELRQSHLDRLTTPLTPETP